MEAVKAVEFTQSSLRDERFSVLNLHMPSVLGLGLAGYVLAKWLQKRKTAVRRAVTSLKIQNTSVSSVGG